MKDGRIYYSELTDFPVCPYCGYTDEGWWCDLKEIKHDGDTWIYDCPGCNSEVKVTLYTSYSFQTELLKPMKP